MNSVGVRFKNDTATIHLVLMKNLSGLPKKYILRTYDLKGSEYSREVLKSHKEVKTKLEYIDRSWIFQRLR